MWAESYLTTIISFCYDAVVSSGSSTRAVVTFREAFSRFSGSCSCFSRELCLHRFREKMAVYAGDTYATNILKEAYCILSDVQRKAAYDQGVTLVAILLYW